MAALVWVVGACAIGGDQNPNDDVTDAGVDARSEEMAPDRRPGGEGTDATQFGGDGPTLLPPPTDAPPGADAPPGCDPVWINLLRNSDLDMGAAHDWNQYSFGGAAVITNGAPLTPHTPAFVAWLTGYNNALEQMWQQVSVPAGALKLRFRGYGCFVTSEPSPGVYDWTTVSLHEISSLTLVETLVAVTNQDVGTSCSFIEYSARASDAYAGRDLYLLIEGVGDLAYPSSFWWDSLALEAQVCP